MQQASSSLDVGLPDAGTANCLQQTETWTAFLHTSQLTLQRRSAPVLCLFGRSPVVGGVAGDGNGDGVVGETVKEEEAC